MGAGEPKKFRDPYAGRGNFKPLDERLLEDGFFGPSCTPFERPDYKVVSFGDGSNLLSARFSSDVFWQPVVLYDALDHKVYVCLIVVLPDAVVEMFEVDWAGPPWTDIGSTEMNERLVTKEFRDAFVLKEGEHTP